MMALHRLAAVLVVMAAAAGAMGIAGCPAFLSWNLPVADGWTDGDAGSACASIPPGWTAWIVQDNVSGNPLPCADGAAPGLVYGDFDAQAATCSACSCVPFAGAGCSAPTMTVYPQGNGVSCEGGSMMRPIDIDMQCTQVALSPGDSVSITSLPLAGSCQSSGGNPSIPDAAFHTVAATCPAVPTQDPCPGGVTCFAAPPKGLLLCIAQDGGAGGCPPSFPSAHPYARDRSFADQRGCTPCNCDIVPGSCFGEVQVFSDTDCKDYAGTMISPLMCGENGSLFAGSAIQAGPFTLNPNASCQSDGGGMPTGSATPRNPVTYCCR